MKFKKNRGGGQVGKSGQHSSSTGTQTKVKERKQLRKQKRLQKKQNKASFYAALRNKNKNRLKNENDNFRNNNSNIPQTNNSNKIKQLQAFVEAEKLKLRNSKAASRDKEATRPTIIKGKKKKVTFENCPSDSSLDEEESTGGFQQASALGSNNRLARLQEFVNQEVGKMKGNKSNCKEREKINVDPKDDSVKVKPNLIKDKRRLRTLRDDQEKDTREIDHLARCLKYKADQKHKVSSIFADDFGSLLQDIETGTLANSQKYKTDEAVTLYDSEDELEKDMALALGQEPKKGKDRKKLKQNQHDDDGESDEEYEYGEMEDEEMDEYEENEDEIDEYRETEYEEMDEYEENEDEGMDEYGENEDEEIVEEGESDFEENGMNYEDEDDSELDHKEDEQVSEPLPKKRKYFVMRQNGHKEDEEEENENDDDESEQVHDDDDEQASEPPPKKRKYLIKHNGHKQEEREENDDEEEDEEKEIWEDRGKDNKDEEDNKEDSEKDEEESEEEEEGFFDSEAEEDDSMEESEDDGGELVHDIRKEEEYAFEGGSGYYSKPEILKNGHENDIDRYSSNSEDDEDLEDFVVDDNEVSYEDVSDGLPPDELSNSPSPVHKKRRRIRIESDDSDEDGKVTEKNEETNDHVLDEDDDEKVCLIDTNNQTDDEVSSEVTTTEYGEFSACEDENEEEPPAANDIIDEKEYMKETELKEDIYGRLRDKDGNIVSSKREETPMGGRYVPPALRKLMALNVDEKKKEQLANVKKSLKGLLNRLAESNLGGIVSQIEAMYLKHSRNDMNEILTALLMESLVAPTLTPERLMQEHALLVAALSSNVGYEVGAHILNEFVLKWSDDVSEVEEVESKELDNLLLFIANLYNFRVMNSKLLYDILNKLAQGFSGKEVELILLVLRSVGFTLRKDDPLALKSLITSIQSKATEAQGSEDRESEFSRVNFMLEVVQGIRNNNMAKVPNYDPSHSEHLKKILRGFLHKGTQSTPLNISLEDLLKSRECGRWWIVGSAWSGGPLLGEKPPQENRNPVQHKVLQTEFSEKFKKRAAKLHLSRPPRINILYAITEGSEDYLDAFEKVLQLNLPTSQERDLFSVILLCCQKGKVYNPFFAHLTNRMCKFDKKYKRLLQFALWDKFQEIESLKPREVANMAKYLTYLIGEDSLSLYILKQISFMDAENQMISFLRQVLIGLLLHPSGSDTVQRVFSGLSTSPKLQVLRQSLRIFILKFLKSKKNVENSDHAMLSKRIKEVTEILSGGGGICL